MQSNMDGLKYGAAFVGVITALPAAGKLALSFFKPAIATAVGSYGTAATLGFVSVIPYSLLFLLDLSNEEDESPSILFQACCVLIGCVACGLSALVLGTPIIPSIACGIVLPVAMLTLSLFENAIKSMYEMIVPSHTKTYY